MKEVSGWKLDQLWNPFYAERSFVTNGYEEWFECYRANFVIVVFISLFIYTAACLSKPSWVEHRFGVAAVSRILIQNWNLCNQFFLSPIEQKNSGEVIQGIIPNEEDEEFFHDSELISLEIQDDIKLMERSGLQLKQAIQLRKQSVEMMRKKQEINDEDFERYRIGILRSFIHENIY